MKRALSLTSHALGSLRRRAGRSVALVLALAVTTAASGSVFLLGESLRLASDALLSETPALTVQRLVGGRPALLDHAAAERLAALPSVRAVHERVWGYLYQPALEGNVVVVGIEAEAVSELRDGLGLETLELGDRQVLVGSALARSLGLRAGDRLALVPAGGGESSAVLVLVVGAILPERAATSHGDAVLATPATARRLLGMNEGDVVDLALEVFPPEEVGIVAARAVEVIPGARVIEREALRRRRALTFEARSGLMSATLLPLLLSFLMLAWDRLSGLGEAERREIGILKAVGFSTADVLTARSIESGLIAVVGASLGVVLAYVHVFVLGAPGLREAYFGWSNLRPDLLLSPTLNAELLLFVVALVALPFLAVSIVPAWRAASLDPERAMRGGG